MSTMQRHWLIENENTPYLVCCWFTKEVIVATDNKDYSDDLIDLCGNIIINEENNGSIISCSNILSFLRL
jgi:hypothetical protein